MQDAVKGSCQTTWRSSTARALHHQVGHAFRRAAASGGGAKCWHHGSSLAGKVAKWCKELDVQLTPDSCSDRPRVLAPQVSDATTASPGEEYGDEDGSASCATTVDWNLQAVQRRKARHRPGRRAKRTSRLAEQQQLIAQLDCRGMQEVEWETFGIPIQAMGLLASCIEEDLEEELDDMPVDPACSLEAMFERTLAMPRDEQNSDTKDSGNQAASSAQGARKRKLKDVEFMVLEREGIEEQTAEERAQQMEELISFNPIAFDAQARILLMGLGAVLQSPCPCTCDEIRLLHGKVCESLDKLAKLVKVPGIHGQVARDSVCLISEEVLEKPSGLRSWIAQTNAELADYDELEQENRSFFFSYFGQEMEEYSSAIGFCLEQLAEIVSPINEDG